MIALNFRKTWIVYRTGQINGFFGLIRTSAKWCTLDTNFLYTLKQDGKSYRLSETFCGAFHISVTGEDRQFTFGEYIYHSMSQLLVTNRP